MSTISLKVPDSLRRELEEVAAARGVTKSAVIRESLAATLRRRRKVAKSRSCLDGMGDLVGHFAGPADLAAHTKRYLQRALADDHANRHHKNRR